MVASLLKSGIARGFLVLLLLSTSIFSYQNIPLRAAELDESWEEEFLPWQIPDSSYLNYMVDWNVDLNLSAYYKMEEARARHLASVYGMEFTEKFAKSQINELFYSWKDLGVQPYKRKEWLGLAVVGTSDTFTMVEGWRDLISSAGGRVYPTITEHPGNQLEIPGVSIITQVEIMENSLFPDKVGRIGSTYSYITNIGAHRQHGCVKSKLGETSTWYRSLDGWSPFETKTTTMSEALFLCLYMKYMQLRTADGYVDSNDYGFVTGDIIKNGMYPSMRAFLEMEYSTPWYWPPPDQSFSDTFDSTRLDNIFTAKEVWKEYYEEHPEMKDTEGDWYASINVGEPEKLSFDFKPLVGEPYKQELEVIPIVFELTESYRFVGEVDLGYDGKPLPAPNSLYFKLVYREWVEANTGLVVKIQSKEEQTGLGSYESWNDWARYGVYPEVGPSTSLSWAFASPLEIEVELIDWGLGARLNLDPKEGLSNMQVKASGADFVGNEEIEIRWDEPKEEGKKVGEAKSNSDGAFDTYITTPENARIGEHTVSAIIKGEKRATAMFTVMAGVNCRSSIPGKETQPLSGIGATIGWDPIETGKVQISEIKEDSSSKIIIPGPGTMILEVPINTISFLINQERE